jgi:hypothetical protein
MGDRLCIVIERNDEQKISGAVAVAPVVFLQIYLDRRG